MSTTLTQRQRQCLDFVAEQITVRGIAPTLRELGAHLGIRSTNGVNDHLRALERKGYLTREGMHARALRVVRRSDGGHTQSKVITAAPAALRMLLTIEVSSFTGDGRWCRSCRACCSEPVHEHEPRCAVALSLTNLGVDSGELDRVLRIAYGSPSSRTAAFADFHASALPASSRGVQEALLEESAP